ncbi:hypothetical protein GCM10009757_28080 [Streptomyces cheonanensis]|uniref:Uncharacterized protein n=1 Tax=Streptomyces cheonanensis TaxID=312720 RepID=A0ABP5GT34_9ACTN|nr:hypothetical protein [Streptomyces harbinensis]QKV70010.1 hypothetical protein HUT13_15430 [Streptomyces harbinensis]
MTDATNDATETERGGVLWSLRPYLPGRADAEALLAGSGEIGRRTGRWITTGRWTAAGEKPKPKTPAAGEKPKISLSKLLKKDDDGAVPGEQERGEQDEKPWHGPLRRLGILAFAVYAAAYLVRSTPPLLTGIVLGWCITAWVLSPSPARPAADADADAEDGLEEEFDGDADDDQEHDAAADIEDGDPLPSPTDTRAAVLALVPPLAGDRLGVHVDELLTAAHRQGLLRGWAKGDLRAFLEEGGTPTGDLNLARPDLGRRCTRAGVRLADLPAAPSHTVTTPAESAPQAAPGNRSEDSPPPAPTPPSQPRVGV